MTALREVVRRWRGLNRKEKGLMGMDNSMVIAVGMGGGGRGYKWDKW